MFYYRAMPAEPALGTALARLESRWGSAAVRVGLGADRSGVPSRKVAAGVAESPPAVSLVDGALALAPAVAHPEPDETPATAGRLPDEIVPTGFARLDALLGTGGLPRGVSASFRGARSSGKTTLALHCLAQAQARGGIVAYLDLCRVFDPLEAAARGVDLRWLLVVRPADADEGWALSAALIAGRQIDLLVVDLPERLRAGHDAQLRRLAAHARRSSVSMIVLEPQNVAAPIHGALAESVALRLELEQRAWLRAGRDIVGRRIQVKVAKNRFGALGKETEIEIRYLAEGEHGAAVARFATAAKQVTARQQVMARYEAQPLLRTA
jgi:recombination protein RecA